MLWRKCWLAYLEVGLIGFAIFGGAVESYRLFRRWATDYRLNLASTSGRASLTDSEADNLGSQARTLRVPALNDAIAASLTWQPPIATSNPSPFDRRAALAIANGDHILGSQHAPITLMLFGDLYCRYTLRMFRLLSRCVEQDPTAYRLVWRQRPLDIHPDAPAAALVAEQLALKYDEATFWRFLHAVSQLKATASPNDIETIAAALPLGAAKLSNTEAATKAAERVEHDRINALVYEIHATPTLFVNGLRLEGELDEQSLDEVVQEEQQTVQDLYDEAVPRAQAYSIRVDENLLDIERE